MSSYFLGQSHRILLVAAAASLGLGSTTMAQSGTRSAPPQPASSTRTSSTAGSSTRSVTTSQLGLQGYCPVCAVERKQWVRGNAAIQANYDGKTYYFPEEKQRQMFLANPEKYLPALGGDCAVCLTEMGQRMSGSLRHAVLDQNRLFLFPSEAMRAKFMAEPSKFNKADLAFAGNCAVCRVEMNQEMPGNPDISVTLGGLRYRFPSDEQRKMFIANPGKYTVKSTRK